MDTFTTSVVSLIALSLLTIGFCVNRTMPRDEKMAELGYCQVYIPNSGVEWTRCTEGK